MKTPECSRSARHVLIFNPSFFLLVARTLVYFNKMLMIMKKSALNGPAFVLCGPSAPDSEIAQEDIQIERKYFCTYF